MRLAWLTVVLTLFEVRAAIYVATNGNDSNPGTLAQPLLTLEAGVGAAGEGGTVYLRGGTYYRTNTLVLESTNNGVTIQNYSAETPIISGSVQLTNWLPVSGAILSRIQTAAQSHVVVSDLSSLGISNYGTLTNRGSSYHVYMIPWMAELFYGKQRQQLCRWPLQDISGEVWAWTVNGDTAAYGASGPSWLTYRESAPATWVLAEPVWVHSWRVGFADSYEQVTAIHTSTNAFITDEPSEYGYGANAPYEILNVLEQLVAPGQYVLDPTNQKLYFWPTSGTNTITELSFLNGDLIGATNAVGITIQGLTLEGARGSGVVMNRCTNMLVAGCEVRNFGSIGLVIGNAKWTNPASELPVSYDYRGGLSNTISGCIIHDTGEGGIAVSGGDRVALTSCYHVVTNNWIYGFNRNIRNYRPAVKVDGVGVTVSHGVFSDSPHAALYVQGNDHVIEYCDLYDLCKGTGDAGAIYHGTRDWKQQGTIYRYNHLHHLPDENGFYLDDFTTGTTVYGNIIEPSTRSVLIGGGRDNTFANNLCLGFSSSTSWYISSRGTSWAVSSIPGLITGVQQVDYTNAPYAKYPGMITLHHDITNYLANPSDPDASFQIGAPKGNSLLTNVILVASPYYETGATNYMITNSNWTYAYYSTYTGFTNSDPRRHQDYTLSASSEAILGGFIAIPQSQIGVHTDAYGLVNPTNIPAYPPQSARGPFLSSPLTVPGTIRVANYDAGPQSNAYYNGDPDQFWNYAWGSGDYRRESEFLIWGTLANGARTYSVLLPPPDWAEFTTSFALSGPYTVTLAWMSGHNAGSYHLNLDGSPVTGSLTFASPTATTSAIAAGTHTLRLVAEGSLGDAGDYLDLITFGANNTATAVNATVFNLKGQ